MKRAVYSVTLILVLLFYWKNSVCVLQAADSASLSISASVVLEGAAPETLDLFYVKLTPSDAQTPMPEGGEDTLTFQGEGQNTFSEIHYIRPGIYRYIIYQIPGNISCSYDETQYHLTVTVMQGERELELAAVLYREKEGNKSEFPVFCNKYPDKQAENPPEEPEPTRPFGSVLTGVEDHCLLYIAVMVCSLTIVGIVLRWKKKR